MVVVTKHAEERMMERLGISKKSVNRIANRAYERGLTHKDVSGQLCKWVDSLYLKYHTGNQIRLYGDKAFIFNNNRLITVLPIPKNLLNQVKHTMKKINADEEE